ncbi:diguanylate cyclase [Oscillochloris sp. ZM17-4]|uniref:diguanylate cyclase n=1 Tax=Oscillochloris sp. ZM17-4 TaxID=2866714 RepID=UPI001C732122|nr:diguanylate cyclase [Oscillochloris sp. ZM17-4]MBX0330974.1 diguanylate cyclase [Oscillochloris sp. ZM17-4]
MIHPSTFEMPTTDQMTGLLTADYFRHLLRTERLPAAEAGDEPLSVFLIDLDGFLEVNQLHGREVGDLVLRGVAGLLQATMPESALLTRYSGDEFGGALPDTRLDDAFSLLEELRRRVMEMRLPDHPEVAIRCSIGLAAFPGHGRNEVELVREADEALYLAKSSGRNKVALPLSDSRMITKTSYYTATQLARLAQLAKGLRRNEASLLREALDDVLKKYNDRLNA